LDFGLEERSGQDAGVAFKQGRAAPATAAGSAAVRTTPSAEAAAAPPLPRRGAFCHGSLSSGHFFEIFSLVIEYKYINKSNFPKPTG
jgi:hypothetical protein